jgi:hypothetical protein
VFSFYSLDRLGHVLSVVDFIHEVRLPEHIPDIVPKNTSRSSVV